MKIKQLNTPSDLKLFEEFDASNTTGFATEDLVKIAKQHMEGNWLPPVTAEELLAEDEAEYQAWSAARSRSK